MNFGLIVALSRMTTLKKLYIHTDSPELCLQMVDAAHQSNPGRICVYLLTTYKGEKELSWPTHSLEIMRSQVTYLCFLFLPEIIKSVLVKNETLKRLAISVASEWDDFLYGVISTQKLSLFVDALSKNKKLHNLQMNCPREHHCVGESIQQEYLCERTRNM